MSLSGDSFHSLQTKPIMIDAILGIPTTNTTTYVRIYVYRQKDLLNPQYIKKLHLKVLHEIYKNRHVSFSTNFYLLL